MYCAYDILQERKITTSSFFIRVAMFMRSTGLEIKHLVAYSLARSHLRRQTGWTCKTITISLMLDLAQW